MLLCLWLWPKSSLRIKCRPEAWGWQKLAGPASFPVGPASFPSFSCLEVVKGDSKFSLMRLWKASIWLLKEIGPLISEICLNKLWVLWGSLWASCDGWRAKEPSHCTSMAKRLPFGFWIMKIGPLVSKINPGQPLVPFRAFWALSGPLVVFL